MLSAAKKDSKLFCQNFYFQFPLSFNFSTTPMHFNFCVELLQSYRDRVFLTRIRIDGAKAFGRLTIYSYAIVTQSLITSLLKYGVKFH